mmetsp:Transcript_5996/g.5330  ORF Transcript_5996/g.5330 Transcript_5996/m.5330 type:complete len:112 (-) Transcript_5996:22-357(-)
MMHNFVGFYPQPILFGEEVERFVTIHILKEPLILSNMILILIQLIQADQRSSKLIKLPRSMQISRTISLITKIHKARDNTFGLFFGGFSPASKVQGLRDPKLTTLKGSTIV